MACQPDQLGSKITPSRETMSAGMFMELMVQDDIKY
jgi:hypothetical protein